MFGTTGRSEPLRLNVLLLDGGGVRGLSTLLILQLLMNFINERLKKSMLLGETFGDVNPHQIFDFVAGTSTGGLIAIMLGKLGMTVEECIGKYQELSKAIFGKGHLRGKLTRGLAPTKYSGKRLRRCIEQLLLSRKFSESCPMVSSEACDKIACAVVCREHTGPSKYSRVKSSPVCICSTVCPQHIAADVRDAARATSAAPTFFPVVDIAGRVFVGGGMEHNNPSQAIWYHSSEMYRVATAGNTEPAAQVTEHPGHGGLDFSRARYINFGTGMKTDQSPKRKRDEIANYVPGFIKMDVFLRQTLTEITVNAENHAQFMRAIQHVSEGKIKYERFSAGNALCWIKLDRYKELEKIEQLTRDYLGADGTQAHLRRVAADIAADYLAKVCPQGLHRPPALHFSEGRPSPRSPHPTSSLGTERITNSSTGTSYSSPYQDSNGRSGTPVTSSSLREKTPEDTARLGKLSEVEL
ncbi:hypothetical protein MMC13_004036 [Lambiella insularis]|nr:hypothetical protein [Lambiella insularis]